MRPQDLTTAKTVAKTSVVSNTTGGNKSVTRGLSDAAAGRLAVDLDRSPTVLALHSTAVKPATHADLGRACFGSARALDAGEPLGEEGAQEFWLLVG
jgi:hypothetical protein